MNIVKLYIILVVVDLIKSAIVIYTNVFVVYKVTLWGIIMHVYRCLISVYAILHAVMHAAKLI